MKHRYLCVPKINNSYYDLDLDYVLSRELIFVFGSNLAGRHGKGTAATALKHYGAIYFMGEGLANRCYAIPTKDKYIKTLPLSKIKEYVDKFIEFTKTSNLYFYVTPIGTGLAGYKHEDIAPMFKGAVNCWFPTRWKHLLEDDVITKEIKNDKR